MEPHQNKDQKFISLVIHVKENHTHLASFLGQLNAIISSHFENVEYILIHNAPDVNLSEFLRDKDLDGLAGTVQIVHLSWIHNIEDAMRAGLDLSLGDFVFEFDSIVMDYPPELIWDVYRQCIGGYDAVAAAPEAAKPFLSSLFYRTLTRFSKPLELSTETFRVVSRRMLNVSSRSKETFRYRKLCYLQSGLPSKTVRYSATKNIKYQRDFSLSEQGALAGNIMVYYSSIGTQISLILSLIFLLISVLVGLYAIVSFIVLKEQIQAGWTTTMLFLSISFTGIFGILAVISKYMQVLLKEVQKQPSYTYTHIETLKK
ncbi:MAG: hypothetical protein IPN29_07105 [Saprospiraceae bacterium]|nr:hypothetical protein [Saprospiraceae bacterium]